MRVRVSRVNTRRLAFSMLQDLYANRLDVALTPAQHGRGKVRIVVAQNPAWYRRLCREYPSSRVRRNQAFDTKIRRRETLRHLKCFATGVPCRSVYHDRLIVAMQAVERDDAAEREYEKRHARTR